MEGHWPTWNTFNTCVPAVSTTRSEMIEVEILRTTSAGRGHRHGFINHRSSMTFKKSL